MGQMNNLPEAIPWFIGIMIVCNLGSIGAMIVVAFKITWWASQMDLRLASAEDTQKEFRLDLDAHEEQLNTLSAKLITKGR